MNTRIPMLVLLVTLAAASNIRLVAQATPTDQRPNIIYIMVDDLGYGDVGCFGQQVIQTPNIDQLAAGGIKLTDHYAGHTVCRPSRLVLWLGQHVGHTRLAGNRPRRLGPNDTTVASLLQSAGYTTGGVGKWSLGHVTDPSKIDNPGHPNRNGFDYWYGYMNQRNAHNYYPTFLWENDKQITLPGNVIDPSPGAKGLVASKRVSYSHDFLTEAAFGFIRRNKDKPFLLHVHWTIPHANNEGGSFTGNGMEVPDYGIYADKDWPNTEKGFAAMITHMDSDVGRLMKLLKELNLDDRTLVIFTSDNGPHQEGGHKHAFFNSNGDLTGFKRSMHEGGIRIPMIARWPGKIAPGTVSNHPSGFYDFLPTACEIAGVDSPENIDGISYLPTLLGKPNQQPKHEYLYCASIEGKTSVGVRNGDWKLIKYRPKQNKKQPEQNTPPDDWRLYNLANDIGEKNNVAEQHPDIVKKILELLKRDGLL